MRFWLRYPDELTGYWQMPWQFKTSDSHTGDVSDSLRVSLFATPNTSHNGTTCPGAIVGQWHWLIQADPGVGTPGTLKWQQCDPTAEVPIGKWFKVEVFVHRATSATGTGRVWVAVGGNEILDYTVQGTTLENGMHAAGSPIDRLMLPQQYGGGGRCTMPRLDGLDFFGKKIVAPDVYPSSSGTPWTRRYVKS